MITIKPFFQNISRSEGDYYFLPVIEHICLQRNVIFDFNNIRTKFVKKYSSFFENVVIFVQLYELDELDLISRA